jgi:aerobic-type carbon monoxide dehydrogenase small subunit (CoxS/CutS family)
VDCRERDIPTFDLTVNGERRRVSVAADTPLLWVLRDTLGLTGTKFGCGVGACGACTVLRGDQAVHACQVTVSEAAGGAFTTIESPGGAVLDQVRRAWLEADVAQCGYCQPGMILRAVALLREHPHPSDTQVDEAYVGMACRCGTYARMRRAIAAASDGAKEGGR